MQEHIISVTKLAQFSYIFTDICVCLHFSEFSLYTLHSASEGLVTVRWECKIIILPILLKWCQKLSYPSLVASVSCKLQYLSHNAKKDLAGNSYYPVNIGRISPRPLILIHLACLIGLIRGNRKESKYSEQRG